MPARLANREL